MIRTYIKIAWRNLSKSKLFSSINVFGLSVGMACCMLLLLYINSELSFDRHHEFANDIYLLRSENTYNGEVMDNPRAPSPYAQAMKTEYPEVVQVTRVWQNFLEKEALLRVTEGSRTIKAFNEKPGYQVDATFFDVFTYRFLEGDPHTALADAHAVVLSEALARKLFGNAPALNKTIQIGGVSGSNENFQITGVYRDESNRSHIDAPYFLSIQAGWVGGFLREQKQDFSSNNMFYTYLRIRPGTDAGKLEQKLPAFVEKYARQDLKLSGSDKKMALLSVKDIHLFDKVNAILTPTSSVTYLYVLGSIALFTLLLACINFMNLATARSVKRAAEVGMRKVMGAQRSAIMGQFLGESMVLTMLALLVAVALVLLLLPAFNQLSGKVLTFTDLLQPSIVAAFLALAILTGLVAGSYPAFYLSVFHPLDVIKGKFVNSASATLLRRGLVVFQFVISIGLVVATIVIQGQMRFLREQPLGFNQDQQIVLPLRSEQSRTAYPALRNELLQSSKISGAAGTGYYPGILNPSDMGLYRPEQSVNDVAITKSNWVSPEFMELMGFKAVAGRLLSKEFMGDTANQTIVVNEATLRKFAIPLEKAIGQKLTMTSQNTPRTFEIVGVVQDFHFADLHQVIEPYAFLLEPASSGFNYLIAHTNTADMGTVLPFIEAKWKSLVPDEPFSYSFLHEDFQKNYDADARTARIVNVFTIISILISCLGLFGLTAFEAQQRIKEIGVRKVLGASVVSIVALLSKDFLKLVVVAIVLATPLTWYLMDQWLQDFAYKIAIEWWVFVLAGVVAVGIALLTVSFQSIKAALMNPVKSLRSE
jgi:putative ABC transport system permease protein